MIIAKFKTVGSFTIGGVEPQTFTTLLVEIVQKVSEFDEHGNYNTREVILNSTTVTIPLDMTLTEEKEIILVG